jgi:uncharacterized protein YegP (UPF0339 family)
MKLFRALAAAACLAFALPACDSGGDDTTGDEQNATAASGTFEIFKDQGGQYRFQLLAKNGERILASQGYTSRTGAKNGIKSVQTNGATKAKYTIETADNGEHYFNLKAGNGQVIGTSETYTTKSNAQAGVDAVIRALASASTADAEAGAARFETFKGQDNKTYFRLRAANGQIVLSSQGYASKSSAESGIATVKKNGIDATRFDVFEGVNGQHTFRLKAGNGQIIGRGEMYASKSNAFRATESIRDLIRELSAVGDATDTEVENEIVRAADGIWYSTEGDYPFTYVKASQSSADGITEELVREAFGALVDADEDADKPMASLYAMEESWEDWKNDKHACYDDGDTSPEYIEGCAKMRNFEQVLESNLRDVKVFYFGRIQRNGRVDGVAVSVFIVGYTPDGNLAGVKSLAIWT